jgi:hypothetical protein
MRELMGARVEAGPADFRLAHPVVDGPLPSGAGHLAADQARAILRIDGVGTFAIADGTRVRVDPEPSVAADVLAVWLHGTVAALLLAQRGRFALHASVVGIDGVGVAVAGDQRAGKSTTALRLTQLGHSLAADDVSPLDAGDVVTVHPFGRPVHVPPDTAAILGLELSDARPILPDNPKLALPAPPGGPVPLGAIAVLRAAGTEPGTRVTCERVSGGEAYWLIGLHTYRVRLLNELWQSELFAWATRIAQRVPVHVITRPRDRWTVDAVAHVVEGLVVSRTRSAP